MVAIVRWAPVDRAVRISQDGMRKRVTETFRTARFGKMKRTHWEKATELDVLKERTRRVASRALRV